MSFFQNVFNEEFIGVWVLADRKYSLDFICPANKNSSDYLLAWNNEPYDLSANNTLTINYAYDVDFKNYSALAINIAGATPAATTASEIVALLNANATFSDMWTAQVYQYTPKAAVIPGPTNKSVIITAKSGRIKRQVRTWITNSSAEIEMRFNLKAGVAELPSYMERHTIENRFNFPDSQGMLILLDETDPIDQAIIEAAGFVPADMLADWELLRGRAGGLFTFKKITVDGSNRITEIIEYPAGAQEGDFARKIEYTYTAANTNPDQITEIPHVLITADLVTP